MKRALAIAAVLGGCSSHDATPAPSAAPGLEAVLWIDGDGLRVGSDLDGDARALATALASVPGVVHTASRAERGRALVVVELAADAERSSIGAAVQAVIDAAHGRSHVSYNVRDRGDVTRWFVGDMDASANARTRGDPTSRLAEVSGVDRLSACGVGADIPTIHVHPNALAATGHTVSDVSDAIVMNLGSAALADVALGHVRLGDVATIAPRAEPACFPHTNTGPLRVAIELHTHLPELPLAIAASAGVRPLAPATTYESRLVVPNVADELGIERAVGSADGVVWVVGELELAAHALRLVVGVRDGVTAAQAADIVQRATASSSSSIEIERLGGASELEAVLAPDAAPAVLARLRTAGTVVAGCDGCADRAEPVRRYAVDDAVVARLGIDRRALDDTLAALGSDGLDQLQWRIVIDGEDPERLAEVELPAGSGSAATHVPLTAVVRVDRVPAQAYLRDDGRAIATVWVRAATDEAARAALAAVVPAGTTIRARRSWPE